MFERLMHYRFFYKLMPKWVRFKYHFNNLIKSRDGCLDLENGYTLNFETMTIDRSDKIKSKYSIKNLLEKHKILCIRYANIEKEYNFPSKETDLVWDNICEVEEKITKGEYD